VWSLIAIQGQRQYRGNYGYDDDIASTYRYDSDVANSRQVSQGDLVVIRDSQVMLGIGVVERIVSETGTKKRLRCPECNVTAIKRRQTVTPRWRCNNRHTFDDAIEEVVPVTRYEAHYGSSYLSANGRISSSQVRSAAMRPSTQLSIEELSPAKLERFLVGSLAEARPLFLSFVQYLAVEGDDAESANQSGLLQYSPSIVDKRNRVLRPIKERRGQSKFRKKLIRRYGSNCMISGCVLLDVVEAAHIWPYRGQDDNHPDNGLLLRADLHTLFDLNLLGICPETLCVSIAEEAKQGGYAEFDKRKLKVVTTRKPSRQALSERWKVFSQLQGYAVRTG
jgi:hypothetical protein